MPITVTATPDITKGKDIENKPVKGKLPPFGETTYDGMEIADIQMACQDSNTLHKDFEPDGRPEADDKHKECNCTCWLTGVKLKIKFTVRYNPDRIKDGYISPNPPYRAHDKQESGDLKLDEKSVEIHEQAHADYLSEKIQKMVKDALDKIEKTAFASCKCGESTKCKDNLKRQVQDQLDAIAKAENANLQKEVQEDYINADTEKQAREKQVKYLQDKAKGK